MPKDDKANKNDAITPPKALPEDLGLEDEIRQISRKVNRIMKRVEKANAAVQAIITPETESKTPQEESETSSENNTEEPPQSRIKYQR